ncbi:uncharacterized protein VTP21DRAFT_443 [Calcarisporiella thermophila]|uniref:uncharacterized protein n=1 Tax=Calcarisporiella thermophila TaxID=911321 RepID=UPI003743E7AA
MNRFPRLFSPILLATTRPRIPIPSNMITPPLASFYKRQLPDHLVSFSSPEGKSLFKKALQEGYLENYFLLAQQYTTQSDPAFCALSSLTTVLNALEIDPKAKWKGVWRWYHDELLDCCRPLEHVRLKGVTLPEFGCLARCNGLSERTYRADQTTKEMFLSEIKQIMRSSNSCMVVSYSRKTLGQTGDGHFSPVAGFCESEKMVLILDTARFKYGSYWVDFDLLWESLFPCDSETGLPRGFSILCKQQSDKGLVHLALNKNSWNRLSSQLFEAFPTLLGTAKPSNALDVVRLLVSFLPPEFETIVESRRFDIPDPSNIKDSESQLDATMAQKDEMEYRDKLETLLSATERTPLFELLKKSAEESSAASREKLAFLTLFFYSLPLHKLLPPGIVPDLLLRQVSRVMHLGELEGGASPDPPVTAATAGCDDCSCRSVPLIVKSEVEFLQRQMRALAECCESECKQNQCSCARGVAV